MTDLAQPFVEGGGAGADVLPVDGVERGDGDFLCPLGRRFIGLGHGGAF